MLPEDYMDSRTLRHMDNDDFDWTDAESLVFVASILIWIYLVGCGLWLIFQELI